MTDDVWRYIMQGKELPEDAAIDREKAAQLRYNLEYFYPMDIRSSGKDLIPNHLTFCIYVHSAIFPEDKWPLSMRANGHLMLNGKKMSKSTGNFLTLSEAVKKFGADATRLTLADSGDEIGDAKWVDSMKHRIREATNTVSRTASRNCLRTPLSCDFIHPWNGLR
jgi:leucyl-tRNA synthetase